MLKKLLIIVFIVTLLMLLGFKVNSEQKKSTWWTFASIDTMKYSRDLSREKLNDPSFNTTINKQVTQIAATGATHVAIATPYDEEFYPILKRWTNAARRNKLKVWFRGNWSGWEGWFNYPKITRVEHIKKTQDFIKKHEDIFVDGDVFSACPECENGGPGDPRRTGDVAGHRKFLIDEYNVTKAAFREINKNVASNFDSMNGDVARVVMDRDTTKALDGIVTIDHYVATPDKLTSDIKRLSKSTGGKIVLGEFGAPIPGINGNLNEEDQALWIRETMASLIQMPEVAGLNYWTNTGSTTALWHEDGEAKKAVSELTSFYKAPIIKIVIKDEAGFGVKEAVLRLDGKKFSADGKGDFYLPYFENLNNVIVMAKGYFPKKSLLIKSDQITIILSKENENLAYKVLKVIKNLF